ncbi:MAG TPA: ABC transporter substrate-binding protein [Stellaceae bacterium]|nr:ABC transporter substrate-binding protein [Stellaceae bacterium]
MATRCKILLRGALSATLVLWLSATSWAADRVRVGVAAVYPPYSIPYAAKELGFYKDAGLDVDVTLYRGSSPAQEAIVSDLVDVITVPPYAVALAITKGVNEKIVAFCGDLRPLGWYVMVRKDSPIQTAADLEGKTIGIGATGSTTDLMALVAMAEAHVTAQRIPLGNPGVMPALKAKQIDAAIAWPLPSYQEILSGDYRPVFDFGKMQGTLLMNSWAAANGMIDQRPAVLKRWLAVNEKTIRYMQDAKNEAWTLAFLKRYTEQDNDRVIKAAYDGSIKPLIADQSAKLDWLKDSLAVATRSGVPNLKGIDGIYAPDFVPSWSGTH